jgi:glycosyltransferase involved in cell wall biosynthesis
LRRTLAALVRQNFHGSTEIILSECERFRDEVPEDLREILPDLRTIYSLDDGSYSLKNAGVQAAAGDLIAILDADCVPAPDWIWRLVDAFRRNTDIVVVSGRTAYEGERFWERAAALLTRSYLDLGEAGAATFISNNNAAWKRSVWLEHPLPAGLGAFACRLQSESVLRAGYGIYFDPSVRVTHSFDGWKMEMDIRRNIGYGTILTRLRDRRLPHAWLTKLGYACIPFVVAGKTWLCLGDCFRCWKQFGLRWYELPATIGLAVTVHLFEAPGMWRALAGESVGETEYR